jgi:hypothetical protein
MILIHSIVKYKNKKGDKLIKTAKIKFINKVVLVCYQIIDTQVARRGRQYHRNPPYKKENKSTLVKLLNIVWTYRLRSSLKNKIKVL